MGRFGMAESWGAWLGAAALVLLIGPGSLSAESPSNAWRVVHYDADLQISESSTGLEGRVVLTAERTGRVGPLRLAAKGLTVRSVEVEGRPTAYQHDGGRLLIELAGRPRRQSVEIVYRAPYQQGLYRRDSVVFGSYHTARWLPSMEAPAELATLALSVCAPSGWAVSGPGEPLPSDGRCSRWSIPTPVPTYLFAFAAGDFDVSTGDPTGEPRVRYFLPQGHSDVGRKRFASTVEALTFMRDLTGVDYPYSEFRQVLVPEGAAQEAAGMALIGVKTSDPALLVPREDWYVIHEVAHQWWGVQRPLASWSHNWLHEGLANYSTALFNGHRFGEMELGIELWRARRRYHRARQKGLERALVVESWSDPAETGGPIAYSKAPLVFHLLRRRLGEEAFRCSIRAHASDSTPADTAALRRAVRGCAAEFPRSFFERWVTKSGVPGLRASHRKEEGLVIVQIDHDGTVSWPVEVEVSVVSSTRRSNRRVVVGPGTTEVRLPCSGRLVSVALDEAGDLPFEIDHLRDLDMLRWQIERASSTVYRLDAWRALAVGCVEQPTHRVCGRTLQLVAADDPVRALRMSEGVRPLALPPYPGTVSP